MSHEAKQFRSLILNHVDAGQEWSVVASEFNGYDSFVRWLESEPLHEDHIARLHAIEMKWREELEKTAKNKQKASGTK
jgi:hypothetical protein